MSDLHQLLAIAFTTGQRLGRAQAEAEHRQTNMPIFEAVGSILAACDELKRDDPVIAQMMREKALGVLHAEEDATIDVDSVEVVEATDAHELDVTAGGAPGARLHSCDTEIRKDPWASSGERQNGETWACSCGKTYVHVCDEAEGCSWYISPDQPQHKELTP